MSLSMSCSLKLTDSSELLLLILGDSFRVFRRDSVDVMFVEVDSEFVFWRIPFMFSGEIRLLFCNSYLTNIYLLIIISNKVMYLFNDILIIIYILYDI